MPRFVVKIFWTHSRATAAVLAAVALVISAAVACCCCCCPSHDGEMITYAAPPLPRAATMGVASDPAGDDASNFGWSPAAVEDLSEWSAAQPKFQLVDEAGGPVWQDNSSADVRLWQLIAHAGGEYPSAGYQETGDCTSWGSTHAIMGTQGGQASRGDPIEIKRPYPPGLYAARVHVWAAQIGGVRNLPSAGCSGSAVARMSQEFGVLPDDTPGLPEYSGAVADRWGRQGLPAEFREIAARHKVKTVARVTTTAEARDAICNFYGITIASPWGNPGHRYQRKDGRWVGQRTGVWSHQMCVDGYDGRFSTKYFHVQNSWPKNQHPEPIDDSPAGGFWITANDLQWILDHKDSWAYSDFEGFPARNRDLDFSPLRPRRTSPTSQKGPVF